jgi:hypothetical protein
MRTITPLDNSNNNNYLDKNIVVSLDNKYVGVVFEETSNKIVVISHESESHDRFEIPKSKVMILSTTGTLLSIASYEWILH